MTYSPFIYNTTIKKIIVFQHFIALLTSIIVVTFWGLSVNPFFTGIGMDSSLYLEMGRLIIFGGTPYVDLFDQKGLYLYLIQVLGLIIDSGKWGIYILLILNYYICFYIWIRTIQLFVELKAIWIPYISTLYIFLFFFECGNLTEDWSLPFISYVIYKFSKYIAIGENIKYRECFFIGLCIGIITFIRVNNNAPICCACIYMMISYIRDSKWKRLLYSIINVISGLVLIIVLTIILWISLYGIETLYDMLYGTFLFNIEYKAKWGEYGLIDFFKLFPTKLSLLIFILTWLSDYKKNVTIVVKLIFAFTFICSTYSNSYYTHYYLVSIHLHMYSFIIMCKSKSFYRLSHLFYKLNCNHILLYVLIFSLPFGLSLKKVYSNVNMIEEKEYLEAQKQYINMTKAEKQSIWNYNAGFVASKFCNNINTIQINRIMIEKESDVSSELHEKGTIRNYHPIRILVKKGGYIHKTWNEDSLYLNKNYHIEYDMPYCNTYIFVRNDCHY